MTRAFPRVARPWRTHRWIGRLLGCLMWKRGSASEPTISSSGSEVDLPACSPVHLHFSADTAVTSHNTLYHHLAASSTEEADNNVVLLEIRSRTGATALAPEKSNTSRGSVVDPFGELEMALYAEGLLEFRDSLASIPVLSIGYGFTDNELMALSKPSSAYCKAQDWNSEPCPCGELGKNKLLGYRCSAEPMIDGLPASVWLECVEPTLSILISLNSLRRRRSNLSLKKGMPEATSTNRCRHGDFELGPIAIFHHPGRIQQMMLLRVEFLNAAATAAAAANNPNNNVNQSAEHNSRRGYNRHRRFRHAPPDEINVGNISSISNYYNRASGICGCENSCSNGNYHNQPTGISGCDNSNNINNSNNLNNYHFQSTAISECDNSNNSNSSTSSCSSSRSGTNHNKNSPSTSTTSNSSTISSKNNNSRSVTSMPPWHGNLNSSLADECCKMRTEPTKGATTSVHFKPFGHNNKLLETPEQTSRRLATDWRNRVKAAIPLRNHHHLAQVQGCQLQTPFPEHKDQNSNARPTKLTAPAEIAAAAAAAVGSTDGELGAVSSSGCSGPAQPPNQSWSSRPMESGLESSANVLGSLVIASAAIMLGTTMPAAVQPAPSVPCLPAAHLKAVPQLCQADGEGTGSEGEDEEVLEDGGDNALNLIPPSDTPTAPAPMAVPPAADATTPHAPSPATVATTTTTTHTTTTQPVDVLALGDHAIWPLLPLDGGLCYLPPRNPGTLTHLNTATPSRPWSSRRHLWHYSRTLVGRARGAWYRWKVRLERSKTLRGSRD